MQESLCIKCEFKNTINVGFLLVFLTIKYGFSPCIIYLGFKVTQNFILCHFRDIIFVLTLWTLIPPCSLTT